MAIVQPTATNTLYEKDHALMHRVVAIDASSPVQSLIVDSAGNIGIGTTSPNIGGYDGSTITFVGSGDKISVFEGKRDTDSPASYLTGFRGYNKNGLMGAMDIRSKSGDADDGFLVFRTSVSNSLTDRVAINNTGMGIGTTAPTVACEVVGTMKASNITLGSGGVINGYAYAIQATNSTITTSTAETVLATFPIAGNSLGATGSVRVYTLWRSVTTGSANKILSVKFGGTLFSSSTITTQTSMMGSVIISNRDSVASQIGAPIIQGNGTSGTVPRTGTLDTTTDQSITITGSCASLDDQLILHTAIVEILK